jgi:hypothetical protein
MQFLRRFFEYPSKHYIVSTLALTGFSMSVLADKNQVDIDIGFIFSLIISLIGATYIAYDILSPITRLVRNDELVHSFSEGRVNYNLAFGIFCFIIFPLATGLFQFHYQLAFAYIMQGFQLAGFNIAYDSFCEKLRRNKEKKEVGK